MFSINGLIMQTISSSSRPFEIQRTPPKHQHTHCTEQQQHEEESAMDEAASACVGGGGGVK